MARRIRIRCGRCIACQPLPDLRRRPRARGDAARSSRSGPVESELDRLDTSGLWSAIEARLEPPRGGRCAKEFANTSRAALVAPLPALTLGGALAALVAAWLWPMSAPAARRSSPTIMPKSSASSRTRRTWPCGASRPSTPRRSGWRATSGGRTVRAVLPPARSWVLPLAAVFCAVALRLALADGRDRAARTHGSRHRQRIDLRHAARRLPPATTGLVPLQLVSSGQRGRAALSARPQKQLRDSGRALSRGAAGGVRENRMRLRCC